MRKIRSRSIIVFLTLAANIIALSLVTTKLVFGHATLMLGDFRGHTLLLVFIILVYMYSLLVYRAFLKLYPLHAGEIVENSTQEFVSHVYILFYLMIFNSILKTYLLPTPWMRLFYLALGAELGENTYPGGIIFDPQFVSIGAHSIVGQSALLVPHVMEGERLAYYPIRVGNHVTIGANSVVLSDVVIGDHAILASGSVVPKGTKIGANEVWGGVPAKLIKRSLTQKGDSHKH